MEVRDEIALLRLASRNIAGCEVRGDGVVEEQIAIRHVLAEIALHHAGVDEVFEEGGGYRAGSNICFGKLDEGD
jgi:hypothetical protein